MVPAPTTTQRGADRAGPQYQLSVNVFDRTATVIVSLLIMVGAAVAFLAIVFFSNKFSSTVEPIAFVPVEATSPNANQGLADQPEPPGAEEAPELIEPQLQDTLETLTTMSLEEALSAEEAIDAATEASKGQGLGDARQAGPGGDGVVERVQRWERWKIRFEPSSPQEFAQWLDHFDIRVGVLGSDNKVHVAYGFTGTVEVESTDPAKYGGWGQTIPVDGPMPALTRELARKSGILSRGPIILLFYPKEVENVLWLLEKEKNPSGDPNKIRETVFTVTPDGSGFKFVVIGQKYF
jgi:hypothetical protein